MMPKKCTLLLLLVLALGGAFVGAQFLNCELMDGAPHTITSCPTAMLPAPLVLGLVLLFLVTLGNFTLHQKLVPLSIYRPPRPHRAR